jgi:hypothetical protein
MMIAFYYHREMVKEKREWEEGIRTREYARRTVAEALELDRRGYTHSLAPRKREEKASD